MKEQKSWPLGAAAKRPAAPSGPTMDPKSYDPGRIKEFPPTTPEAQDT